MLLIRRALAGLSVAAASWAIAVAATGGFFLRLGAFRISSRRPWVPLAVAGVAGLAVFLLGRTRGGRTTWADERAWWSGQAAWLAAGLRGAARLLFVPAVAIAVAGTAVDVHQWLRNAPLWVDEEMIALNVRDRSFAELPGVLWLGQSAPLGWLIAERAALLAFGTSELSLRFVPLLAGILTLAAAAWLARRWMGLVAGGVFVALCWIAQWLSHYRFEVKHYSADAFAALLLPALAAWALEAEGPAERVRWRWTRWWAVAALAQWFANGAVMVTPACAVLLALTILRRHGVAAAARFAATGVLWLVSFAAHYELSLQFTHHSRYLRTYWAGDVPPDTMGPLEILGWIGARLGPLADSPGGTSFVLLFWGAAVLGLAFTSRRAIGAMFATVPLSAFALAALRVVPLQDRVSLWIAPSLYLGIALFMDEGLASIRGGWRVRSWGRVAAGVMLVAIALPVAADIIERGRGNLDLGPRRESNHAVDDRGAVKWLMRERKPGDALVTTRLAWPAIWWYGPIPVHRNVAGGRLPDGSVMYQAGVERTTTDCGRQLLQSLRGHSRVIVYVGFPDMPYEFFALALDQLSQVGTVTEVREFTPLSRIAIVQLHEVSPRGVRPSLVTEKTGGPSLPEGCLTIRRARRW